MLINKTDRENMIIEMDGYFNLQDIDPKEEIKHVSEELRVMSSEDISILIDMFGSTLASHYLEKQISQGNKLSFNIIEPFVIYLDKYLIERAGGDLSKLSNLSEELTGRNIDYPTQRLLRFTILDNYFSPYFKD